MLYRLEHRSGPTAWRAGHAATRCSALLLEHGLAQSRRRDGRQALAQDPLLRGHPDQPASSLATCSCDRNSRRDPRAGAAAGVGEPPRKRRNNRSDLLQAPRFKLAHPHCPRAATPHQCPTPRRVACSGLADAVQLPAERLVPLHGASVPPLAALPNSRPAQCRRPALGAVPHFRFHTCAASFGVGRSSRRRVGDRRVHLVPTPVTTGLRGRDRPRHRSSLNAPRSSKSPAPGEQYQVVPADAPACGSGG